jgi:hypothetical protein
MVTVIFKVNENQLVGLEGGLVEYRVDKKRGFFKIEPITNEPIESLVERLEMVFKNLSEIVAEYQYEKIQTVLEVVEYRKPPRINE